MKLTQADIDRLRLLEKAVRFKLSVGTWSINDETIGQATVELLQYIIAQCETEE